jgi:ribosomal protein S27AE
VEEHAPGGEVAAGDDPAELVGAGELGESHLCAGVVEAVESAPLAIIAGEGAGQQPPAAAMVATLDRPRAIKPRTLGKGQAMAKGNECPKCGSHTLQPYTTNQLKCSKCSTIVRK